jgi:hypothetical protein
MQGEEKGVQLAFSYKIYGLETFYDGTLEKDFAAPIWAGATLQNTQFEPFLYAEMSQRWKRYCSKRINTEASLIICDALECDRERMFCKGCKADKSFQEPPDAS